MKLVASSPPMGHNVMRHTTAQPTRLAIGVALASLIAVSLSTLCSAADPSQYLSPNGQHRLFSSDMPPGVLGQARLAGRPPICNYCQPVSISSSVGARFALAQSGAFVTPAETFQAGLLIGGVYRFQITSIPGAEGAELYPTIEVIDRTYPPPGLATRYPIEVMLDQDDFDAALAGRLVTRVIFLEDPQTASPTPQTPQTNRPLEIAEYQDALETADRFGRPVAIVRIGSVAPPRAPELLPGFFFGYPVWSPIYQPEQPAVP